MSIVLNVVSPCTSWIVTDGRGITKTAIRENIRKCQPLGSRFYIGYTGTLEYAEAAMDLLRQNCPKPESVSLEEVAAYLLTVSKYLRSIRKDDAQFLITGVREVGLLGSCTISKTCELQLHYPTNSELKVTTLSPLEDFHATNYFRPRSPGVPFERYIKATMKEIVARAAEMDVSINTNTMFYVMYLDPKTGEVRQHQEECFACNL